MKKLIKNVYNFCRNSIRHFLQVNGLVRASALAYTTLLALVPLSVVGLGIMSAFPVFHSYINRIDRFLFRHFVPSSADVIQEYIEKFAIVSSRLSIIGFIFSLITAILLVTTMQETFDAIWQAKKQERRHGLSAFLMYWALMTLLPLVGASALAATLYLSSLPYISSGLDIVSHYLPVKSLISLAFSWLAFALLYVTLPNHKVKFRFAALGALIAAFLFECTKQGFTYYVNNISSDQIIYGALAAIPTFLLWLYISWIIILFGAVLSHLFASKGKVPASHR